MEIVHLAYVFLFVFTFSLLGLRGRGALWPKPRMMKAHCPHPNPVLGNTLEFIRNRRRFFDWYTDLLRAAPSGTIEAWGPFGVGHAVTTACPADVDHLLHVNFANYAKGARFRAATAELIGDGLFAADGRLRSFQRKLASHVFSSRVLQRFTDDVLSAHLERRLLPFLDAAVAASTCRTRCGGLGSTSSATSHSASRARRSSRARGTGGGRTRYSRRSMRPSRSRSGGR
jgi:hypothetical protein